MVRFQRIVDRRRVESMINLFVGNSGMHLVDRHMELKEHLEKAWGIQGSERDPHASAAGVFMALAAGGPSPGPGFWAPSSPGTPSGRPWE